MLCNSLKDKMGFPRAGGALWRAMQKVALFPAALFCAALLAGCTTARSTVPLRSASEQLLISAAADRAAAQLSLGIPKGTRIFIDTRYFQGYDDGYAIAAVRTQMLKNGLMLVDDRTQAHDRRELFCCGER